MGEAPNERDGRPFQSALSDKQRAWVRDKFRTLDLAKLLAKKTRDGNRHYDAAESMPIMPSTFESMLGPKVVTPPAQSRRTYA